MYNVRFLFSHDIQTVNALSYIPTDLIAPHTREDVKLSDLKKKNEQVLFI